MIADHIRNDIKGNKKMTIAQLVQAMEEPATEDLRGDKILPLLFKAIGTPKSAKLKSALAELKTWRDHGSHRRDLDRNGEDEETPAIELMDAWWPKLLEAEFKPALGPKAYEELEGMLETGSYTGGSPTEPSFDDGWWGYVSKDLRDIYGPKPKAPWSRGYCGEGSKAKCKAGAGKEPHGGAQGEAGGALRRRRRSLRHQPPALLLRRQPPAGNLRHRTGRLPVPEPPDLPAGRDVDPEAGRG